MEVGAHGSSSRVGRDDGRDMVGLRQRMSSACSRTPRQERTERLARVVLPCDVTTTSLLGLSVAARKVRLGDGGSGVAEYGASALCKVMGGDEQSRVRQRQKLQL